MQIIVASQKRKLCRKKIAIFLRWWIAGQFCSADMLLVQSPDAHSREYALKFWGVAFIGRGFSENLPVEIARKVRAKQNGGPKYDVAKTAAELREIMKDN